MKPKYKDLYNWRKVSGMEVEFFLDGSVYGKGKIKATNLAEKADICLTVPCKEFTTGTTIQVDFQEIEVSDPKNRLPKVTDQWQAIKRMDLFID